MLAQLLPLMRFLQAAVHDAGSPPQPEASLSGPASALSQADATEHNSTTSCLASEARPAQGVAGGEAGAQPQAGAGPVTAVPATSPAAVLEALQGQDDDSEGSGPEYMDEGEDEEIGLDEEVDLTELLGETTAYCTMCTRLSALDLCCNCLRQCQVCKHLLIADAPEFADATSAAQFLLADPRLSRWDTHELPQCECLPVKPYSMRCRHPLYNWL